MTNAGLILNERAAQESSRPFRYFARISLREPLLLVPGDRFIVRRPSPALTLAGGRILDTHPPLRWNREKTVQRGCPGRRREPRLTS